MKKTVCLIILATLFFTYYYQSAKHLAPKTFNSVDEIYYADTGDFVRFYQQKDNLNFAERDARNPLRHLMFRPISGTLYDLFKLIFNFEDAKTVVLLIAFLATVNILTAFWVLVGFNININTAMIFTLLYGFSFSNVVFFSIPETYVVTNIAIILFSHLLLQANKSANSLRHTFKLSLAIGLGALFSLTLLSLVLPALYFIFMREIQYTEEKINQVAHNKNTKTKSNYFQSELIWLASLEISKHAILGIFVVCFVLGVFYLSMTDIQFAYEATAGAFDTYSSWANFQDLDMFLNVFASFQFFSVISPVESIEPHINLESALGYLQPFKLITLLLYLFWLGTAALKFVANKNTALKALVLWMFFLMVFHVYYFPVEAMLFSVQIVFVIILLINHAFINTTIKYKYALLVAFSVLLFLANTKTLYIT